MKKLIIFLVLSCVCSSLSSESQSSPSEASIDLLFQEWMLKYNKTYSTSGNEMIKRREIFKRNVLHIQEFNKGNHLYTKGLNQFSDFEEEDIVSCEENPSTERLSSRRYVSSNISHDQTTYPSSFDWRDSNAVTPVRQQGNCGCCWAMAATAAVESLWKITHGDLFILSPQVLIDCDNGSKGCESGIIDSAFEYIANGGIATEKQIPYKGTKQPCRDQDFKTTVRIDGHTWIYRTSEEEVLFYLRNQPLVTTIRTSLEFHQYRGGGIYDGSCGEGKHSVVIVGYGEIYGEKYWTIKNSWGIGWGEYGYGRITRRTIHPVGKCGILLALFPVLDL